jgi:hypothetical protein
MFAKPLGQNLSKANFKTRSKRVLQVSMSEHAKNWANLWNSNLTGLHFEMQFSLLWSQFAQQRALGSRRVQQRVRPQQQHGVGQQRHAPCEPQAVEKHLPQSELVFLIRLGWLDPRTNLLQQSPGSQRVERQQSQQRFVICRCAGELARATASLPTDCTEFRRGLGPKPMPIFGHLVAEPLQRLALRTGCLGFAHEGRNQFHVRAQMRHDGHAPAFPAQPFAFRSQIAHVGHDLARPPQPAPVAVMQTGNEQTALGNIGWRHPTDQRHQQDCGSILAPPQPKAVLFVADEPAALPSLERASAQRGTGGSVSAGVFFLKPLQAAGRSVASMSAVAFCQSAAVWINGWRIASLICRRPSTPARTRNALRMRTSGVPWRWRSRAKFRHARCSGNNRVNRLSECTGVNNASRCVRQSWAGLNCQRGPRTGRVFQCSLMKSSGMYGSRRSSNWLEPVTGRRFMEPEPTLFETLRPAFVSTHIFPPDALGQ